MDHEYFFELLSEEIPAWMLPSRLSTLEEGLRRFYTQFAGETAADQAIQVDATSRRIFFALRNLPDRQPDREDEVKGPPLKSAYDKDGNPSQALSGFLKKNSASSGQVQPRDDYVWLKRRVPGATAVAAIQSGIPPLIETLRWPKMMRWGKGEYAFIRPIHSVISMFAGKPVPIRIFDLDSGSWTRGHHILANERIEVSSFADYREKLERLGVVVEAKDRTNALRERADTLASDVDGEPAVDDSIWEQWRYLTEFPGLVRAEFNPAYLSLPMEVLVTVMRIHQKQLPVMRGSELTNSFLAVMDAPADVEGNVASGNSFVTNARFADARFFYEADRRKPLAERLPELEHLQFQEKLGDYRMKTERIVNLALAIHRAAASSSGKGHVNDAAFLCKTDLVTEMVKEFTELQGRIGGIYAREEKRPVEVWQGIYDHYLPTSIDGDLPRGEVGALVALADKVDTLCGFFSIGLKPSGSRDPFALRRAAQGAVQILLNRERWHIDIPIDRLLELGFSGYQAPAAIAELHEFLAERVRTLLESPRYGNFSYDEINAVMEPGWSNSLLDVVDRATALHAVRNSPEFLSILDSAKRIANIAGTSSGRNVSTQLLEHATEKRLASIAEKVEGQIGELVAAKQYRAAFESFAGMAPELEKFFVDVMVMVDDEKVRNNRMALLRKVGNAVSKIADVTKVVVDRSEYAPGA
jgi:glycyl-tRNA synthetase beta chain